MNSEELKQYIVDKEKIELILEDLGCNHIRFNSNKNNWNAAQPGGDNTEGVVIKNNYYLNYYSYSRGVHIDEKKDIFFLIAEIKGFEKFKETMRYIHQLLGLEYAFVKTDKKTVKKDYLAIFKKAASKRSIKNSDYEPIDENILTEFVPMIHIDLFREGIIKKTIDKFKLGYSYKWKRTIFPHRYWANGLLLGYNARTSIENYEEFEIKKYFITPGMKKEINLYGLYENKQDIENAGYIVIGESEKNVLKRDSRNDCTWVGLSGKTISQEQIRIILGLEITEVIIALDNDVPIEEVYFICEQFFRSRKVSFIRDRWGLLKKKDSPADAVDKIYKFLFKYRTVYGEKHHREYLKGLK
ncbi:hypothetical protein [Clostridium sp.]|uniref:hypothetical protein n=1 Tax=Clostridium sp. TaxID=1506 RepID=UPI00321645AF